MLSLEQEINDNMRHIDNNFFTYRLLFPSCMICPVRDARILAWILAWRLAWILAWRKFRAALQTSFCHCL